MSIVNFELGKKERALLPFLKKNYNDLDLNSYLKCHELIKLYLKEESTVLGKDPIFIKRLTKVARNLINSGKKYDKHYKKLSVFGIECIENLRERDNSDIKDVLKFKSHLYSHSALFIRNEYYWSFDKKDLQKCYDYYLESAILSKKIGDLGHSCRGFHDAGNAAKDYFGRSFDFKHGFNAIKCYKESINLVDCLMVQGIFKFEDVSDKSRDSLCYLERFCKSLAYFRNTNSRN